MAYWYCMPKHLRMKDKDLETAIPGFTPGLPQLKLNPENSEESYLETRITA